ncbi:hypothetical protein TGRUB_257550 [Toxoplasma gondii RUB]|uniref:Uncharacterized protein n=1 Tax=Toxoplasma gondii RUB TaxID=935652 RepID=A0A086M811_TOXGO|nr:hypothetical protein TGRUB_257550 [Toxoplasma gondii RUB]
MASPNLTTELGLGFTRGSEQGCDSSDTFVSRECDEGSLTSTSGLSHCGTSLRPLRCSGSLRTVSYGGSKMSSTAMHGPIRSGEFAGEAHRIQPAVSSSFLVSTSPSLSSTTVSGGAMSLSSLLNQMTRSGATLQQLQSASERHRDQEPRSPAEGGPAASGTTFSSDMTCTGKEPKVADSESPAKAVVREAASSKASQEILGREVEQLRGKVLEHEEELYRQKEQNQMCHRQLQTLQEELLASRESLQPAVESLTDRVSAVRTQMQQHETLLDAQRQALIDQQQVLQAEVIEVASLISSCETAFKEFEEREAAMRAEVDQRIRNSQSHQEEKMKKHHEEQKQELLKFKEEHLPLRNLPEVLDELGRRIQANASTQKDSQLAFQAELCQNQREYRDLRDRLENMEEQSRAHIKTNHETLRLLEEHKLATQQLRETHEELLRAQELRLRDEFQLQLAEFSKNQSQEVSTQMQDLRKALDELRRETLMSQQKASQPERLDLMREAAEKRCSEGEQQLWKELEVIKKQQVELLRQQDSVAHQKSQQEKAERVEKKLEDIRSFVSDREKDAQKHYLDLMAALSCTASSSPSNGHFRAPLYSSSQKEVALHAALLLRCTFDAIHAAATASFSEESSCSDSQVPRNGTSVSVEASDRQAVAVARSAEEGAEDIPLKRSDSTDTSAGQSTDRLANRMTPASETFLAAGANAALGSRVDSPRGEASDNSAALGQSWKAAVRTSQTASSGVGGTSGVLSPGGELESAFCSDDGKTKESVRTLTLTTHSSGTSSLCSTRHTTTSASSLEPLGACAVGVLSGPGDSACTPSQEQGAGSRGNEGETVKVESFASLSERLGGEPGVGASEDRRTTYTHSVHRPDFEPDKQEADQNSSSRAPGVSSLALMERVPIEAMGRGNQAKKLPRSPCSLSPISDSAARQRGATTFQANAHPSASFAAPLPEDGEVWIRGHDCQQTTTRVRASEPVSRVFRDFSLDGKMPRKIGTEELDIARHGDDSEGDLSGERDAGNPRFSEARRSQHLERACNERSVDRNPSALIPMPPLGVGSRGSELWGGEGQGERMEWRIDNFIETLRGALESGTDALWSPFFSFNGVQELQMQFLPNVLSCLNRGEKLSQEEKLRRVLDDRACICGLFLWSSSPRIFKCTLCIGSEKREVVVRPAQRPGQARSSSTEPCNAALWEHFDSRENTLTVGVTDFVILG